MPAASDPTSWVAGTRTSSKLTIGWWWAMVWV